MKTNVQGIKSTYKEGMRLRLTADLVDRYSGKKAGEEGTVTIVDDIGQIHMKWDNGGSLAIVPGVDSFEIVE